MSSMPMLSQRAVRIGLFSFVALTLNAATQAALMRYEYGGTITSAEPSTGITPGTRFSGTFTYDPAGNAPWLGFEGYMKYSFGLWSGWPGSQADGSGITLQIGGKTVLSDQAGMSMTVEEQEYLVQYGYGNAHGTGYGPPTYITIGNSDTSRGGLLLGLTLSNPSRSVFQSPAPPTSLNLSDFPVAQLSVASPRLGGPQSLYNGTIDTLMEIPVPEPAWTTLVCMAAVGWIARSSRRIRA